MNLCFRDGQPAVLRRTRAPLAVASPSVSYCAAVSTCTVGLPVGGVFPPPDHSTLAAFRRRHEILDRNLLELRLRLHRFPCSAVTTVIGNPAPGVASLGIQLQHHWAFGDDLVAIVTDLLFWFAAC